MVVIVSRMVHDRIATVVILSRDLYGIML